MNLPDFLTEYTKLYGFFYKSEQDTTRTEEYFQLLKHLTIEKFRYVCSEIKSCENDLPRNPVAWINNFLKNQKESEIQNKFNSQFASPKPEECSACMDQGWVRFDLFTGKPYEIPSGKKSFVKRCLCRRGQMLKNGEQATSEECQEAASINGGTLAMSKEAPF